MELVRLIGDEKEYVAIADSLTIEDWIEDGMTVMERKELDGDFTNWPINRLMEQI